MISQICLESTLQAVDDSHFSFIFIFISISAMLRGILNASLMALHGHHFDIVSIKLLKAITQFTTRTINSYLQESSVLRETVAHCSVRP